MKQDNEKQQKEELWVIRAIFGDSILQRDEHHSTLHQTAYLLSIDLGDDRVMVLRLFFPSTYPSADCPVFEVTSLYCGSTKIDTSMVDTIQHRFQTLFQPGQVVLYDWIQWLREYIQGHIKEKPTAVAASVVPTPLLILEKEEEETIADALPSIFSSDPLVDRKSVFVAHVAAVKSPKHVNQVMAALLANKKIARATHNIMAYRIQLSSGSILQDHDDDGETAAGGMYKRAKSY
jgi:hypothetical protein